MGALESLILRLSRYRHRKRATSSQSFGTPQFLLPFELWDLVVRNLTDADLLRVALVCRVFNAVAIGEYLARHNVALSNVVLSVKEISVPSQVIHALQLSCSPPDAERLVCNFGASGIHRDLLSLRRMVHRSRNIRELTLDFAGDLFRAHKQIWPVMDSTQSVLLGAACAVFPPSRSRSTDPSSFWTQFRPARFQDSFCAGRRISPSGD
ncbi:hypothetical protein B0H16DRAFT_53750 [Mycena metata]|uniref:F-box domain-containing protein n=1 Tax=Mycena metata TaxID=1033252 RepID=A0AAD7IDB1_9AGAR|nr:hypothetical protein B0H16DRAFT_53750 [Mycena metata]